MSGILVEINGTRLLVDEELLEKTEGRIDTENEHTTWTEWRLDGMLVKRSAHVRLKKNIVAEGIAAMLGN